MATEIDKLVVKIEADLQNLKKGLKNATTQVDRSSKQMKQNLNKVGDGLARAGIQATKFATVAGTALGIVAVKGFVDVASQVENLQVLMKALFGSAEEGALAFDKMAEFASKVPFSLRDIQRGAGSLAVVSDDAEELAKILEITGNVAAITGLDFAITASQIQRSFSGGIAAADLFREAGVRNMLGFAQGAKVSVEETRRAFEEVFGKGGKFGNATDELAKTLTGTLSMLGDKFFNFQRAVGDEFFGELKEGFQDLDETLAQNELAVNRFARNVGRFLLDLGHSVAESADLIIESLKAIGIALAGFFIFRFLGKLAKLGGGLRNFTESIKVAKDGVKKLNAFLLKLLGTVISLEFLFGKLGDTEEDKIVIDQKLIEQNDKMAQSMLMLKRMHQDKLRQDKKDAQQMKIDEKILKERIKLEEKMADAMARSIKMREDMRNDVLTQELEELLRPTEELIDVFNRAGEEISEAFANAVVHGKDFADSMFDIFQSVIQQVVKLAFQILVVEDLMAGLEKVLRERKVGQKEKNSGKASFFEGLGETLGGGIADFAGGLLGFAGGGRVTAGRPVLVGEQGREVFVPDKSGMIMNQRQMNASSANGGDIIINQNLNFATGIQSTVKAEIMNMLPQIKQSTVSAVAEERAKGGQFAKVFGG